MTLTQGGAKRVDCGHLVYDGENFYLVPKNVKEMFRKGIGDGDEEICKSCYNRRSAKLHKKQKVVETIDMFPDLPKKKQNA